MSPNLRAGKSYCLLSRTEGKSSPDVIAEQFGSEVPLEASGPSVLLQVRLTPRLEVVQGLLQPNLSIFKDRNCPRPLDITGLPSPVFVKRFSLRQVRISLVGAGGCYLLTFSVLSPPCFSQSRVGDTVTAPVHCDRVQGAAVVETEPSFDFQRRQNLFGELLP